MQLPDLTTLVEHHLITSPRHCERRLHDYVPASRQGGAKFDNRRQRTDPPGRLSQPSPPQVPHSSLQQTLFPCFKPGTPLVQNVAGIPMGLWRLTNGMSIAAMRNHTISLKRPQMHVRHRTPRTIFPRLIGQDAQLTFRSPNQLEHRRKYQRLFTALNQPIAITL